MAQVASRGAWRPTVSAGSAAGTAHGTSVRRLSERKARSVLRTEQRSRAAGKGESDASARTATMPIHEALRPLRTQQVTGELLVRNGAPAQPMLLRQLFNGRQIHDGYQAHD